MSRLHHSDKYYNGSEEVYVEPAHFLAIPLFKNGSLGDELSSKEFRIKTSSLHKE